MARSFTLSQLRTKVRQRADIESSSFVSDSELNGYISASYAALLTRLARSGIAYFQASQTISATAGDDTYAVPADYMSTVGVDWQQASGKYVSLRRIMPKEHNDFPEPSHPVVGYSIINNEVTLFPVPSLAGTYRHRYVPAPDDLTADGDVVDGVAGWEEWIVNDAAMKCLAKEESDTSFLERQNAALEDQIDRAAADLYTVDTPRIQDFDDDEVPSVYQYGYDWRRLT